MAQVALFDLLKLESLSVKSKSDVHIEMNDVSGPYRDIITSLDISDNLISKAAKEYLNLAKLGGDIIFSIEKNIPHGAGLGGGSADAAAMLRILDEKIGVLNKVQVLEIARNLGADVPFCYLGGIALCEGIGEIMHHIDVKNYSLPYVVIINDGTEVNTGQAYRALDRREINVVENDQRKKILDETLKINVAQWGTVFHNDFESVVFEIHPHLKELKDELIEQKSEFTIMTGSGSSLVGFFRNYNDAIHTVSHFKSQDIGAYLTEFEIY
jgi:4-diphosphocytidyl-2-C-methyl-D-erythritol kinase